MSTSDIRHGFLKLIMTFTWTETGVGMAIAMVMGMEMGMNMAMAMAMAMEMEMEMEMEMANGDRDWGTFNMVLFHNLNAFANHAEQHSSLLLDIVFQHFPEALVYFK